MPIKAAVAGVALALVLWAGWSFLGPAPSHAEETDRGTETTLTSNTSGQDRIPADDALDELNSNDDVALSAILGPGSNAKPPSKIERETGLLTASLPNTLPSGAEGSDEPVRGRPLPDPHPVEINTVQRQPESLATGPGAAEAERRVAGGNLPAAEAALLDADVLIAENRPVDARTRLNAALLSDSTDAAGRSILRERMSALNETLLFGPIAHPDDPMTEMYSIVANDSLARIASRRELATHWKLIARVNGITNPGRIRVGQSVKLVRGPFHAVVDKSDYRLDVYHGPPDSPTSWTYIRSFRVGLGERDGTPTGSFVISSNKLENPGWTNPRNSTERYGPDDPANPIGDYWVGLTGLGESAGLSGYGLHGTIEPESIGSSMSMGCIRLADVDIAVVYELLEEHISVVHIIE